MNLIDHRMTTIGRLQTSASLNFRNCGKSASERIADIVPETTI